MADNMQVTPAPVPLLLSNPTRLTNGAFQFAFTHSPDSTPTVRGTTNPGLPLSNWTTLAGPTETAPGQCLFTDLEATNASQRFYRIGAP